MKLEEVIVNGIANYIMPSGKLTYDGLKKLSKPNHVIMLNAKYKMIGTSLEYYQLLSTVKLNFSIDSETLYNMISSVIEQYRSRLYSSFMTLYVKLLKLEDSLIYIPVENDE